MTARLPRLLLVPLVVALLVALDGAAAPVPAVAQTAPGPLSTGQPTAGQSTYAALEPVRLLDTRERGTRVGPGESVEVALGSRVPATARAVVLNVTGLGASSATEVEAHASGSAATGVAQLPVAPQQIAAELVVVPLGSGSRVTLRNASGSLHLLADLTGYYAEQEGPGYVAAPPRRLLDTREAGGALGPAEVRTLQVTGGAVPADATAAVLNVTAVGATASQTDVRVYPTRAGAPPVVSLTNPGRDRPTNAVAIATLGSGGRVSLRNAAGAVHLVVDLQGWYVPGQGDVFHPAPPARLLETALQGGQPRDLVVAGAGTVPSQASAVALTVRVARTSPSSDVRVYPADADAPAPFASNLYAVRGGPPVANAVVAAVGEGGAVSLRTSSGSADLRVDVAGWWGPRGNGWDVSWPQCTARGATTSRLPEGGAFAVVGLTRSAPFSDNECFAAQWEWASSLPGEPAAYVNVNAPGPRDTPDGRVWAEVCGTGTPTSTCGQAYGERIAAYAVPRLPAVPGGGKPMVWMDVEGPYANGPFWQTGYAGAVAVNRAVIQGVVDGLRRAGHRVGTYSDRGSVPDPSNDWRAIVGDWRLLSMQNWVFRSPDADPQTVCGPEHSFSGGPVVMAQVQPATNPGVAFDVDGLC